MSIGSEKMEALNRNEALAKWMFGILIVVWVVVIIGFNLPKKIADLTFSFLGEFPFNLVFGFVLWVLGVFSAGLIVGWLEEKAIEKILKW